MVNPEKYGVHQTHCCIVHGCKYGEEDCPVVTGEIVQEYPCEDCPSYFLSGFIHEISVDMEEFSKYEEGNKNFYIYDQDTMEVEKGHTIKINETLKGVPTGKFVAMIISNISENNRAMIEGFAIMSFKIYE